MACSWIHRDSGASGEVWELIDQTSIFDYIEDLPEINSKHTLMFEMDIGWRVVDVKIKKVNAEDRTLGCDISSQDKKYAGTLTFDEFLKAKESCRRIVREHHEALLRARGE